MSVAPLEPQTEYNPPGFEESTGLTKKKFADWLTSTLILDMVAATDVILIIGSAIIAKYVYLDWLLGQPTGSSGYGASISFFELGLLLAVISLLVFRGMGFYDPCRLSHSQLRIGSIIIALGISFLMMITILFILKSSAEYSRGWIIIWFMIGSTSLIAKHVCFAYALHHSNVKKYFRRQVAVYGSPDELERVRDTLSQYSPDLNIVGFYSNETKGQNLGPLNISDSQKALINRAQNERCDAVLIALPLSGPAELQNAIEKFSILPVDLFFAVDSGGIPVDLSSDNTIGGLPVFKVGRRPLTHRQYLLKTLSDTVLAATAIVLLSPVLALIAIAIKLESTGPVFFFQRRHGYNYRIIRVAKFRTMKVLEDSGEIRQAKANDPRVTRVGRFLRKTSLDELPQLWNVIMGEMALVGPRPHALSHNDYYGNLWRKYSYRHRVKPGITGWAQVCGLRGEIFSPDHMKKRAELDLFYIEHWSLLFDLKILLLTALVVIRGTNAH